MIDLRIFLFFIAISSFCKFFFVSALLAISHRLMYFHSVQCIFKFFLRIFFFIYLLFEGESVSHSVLSDSLRPYGLCGL